jgi:integrase
VTQPTEPPEKPGRFSKGGGPLIEPRTGFERAVKRAGLRDVTFHTLRHSFGSHLAMHGKSMYAVQKLMGHATASMTERYSHLSPEHMRDVVKALETVDGHYLVTGAVTGGDKKAASH